MPKNNTIDDEIPGYVQPELLEALESDLIDFHPKKYEDTTEDPERPRIDDLDVEVSLFED